MSWGASEMRESRGMRDVKWTVQCFSVRDNGGTKNCIECPEHTPKINFYIKWGSKSCRWLWIDTTWWALTPPLSPRHRWGPPDRGPSPLSPPSCPLRKSRRRKVRLWKIVFACLWSFSSRRQCLIQVDISLVLTTFYKIRTLECINIKYLSSLFRLELGVFL